MSSRQGKQMGILGDAIGRERNRPTSPPLVTGATPPLPPPTEPAGRSDDHSELRRRRDALAEQVTELHWDLGGLAYEMAIRDHFRIDVLVRRAAALQERDGELAEVERLLRMEDDGMAGICASCAAPHSRGAAFCWQCGVTLMERLPSTTIARHDGSTAVMDALLSTQGAPAAEPDE